MGLVACFAGAKENDGMNAQQTAGRAYLLVYFLILTMLSLAIILLYVIERDTARLPVQAVRFVFTVGLFYWLYQGSHAARWLMIALCVVASLLSAVLVVLLVQGGGSVLGAAFFLLLSVTYGSFAILLLTSSDIEAFLAHQRGDDRWKEKLEKNRDAPRNPGEFPQPRG
jgi:hypothetical protein